MAQYFTSSNKRGELYELSEQLNSTDFGRKKEAIKKVIAHMTIGKDVSPLFHPVVKCLEYDDVELKKLVYLYIINYSKNRPDDAIVVIQLFRKDIQNKQNPMLRALAVRTMGCLKVHKLNEYLADPLKDALNDKEPYVRKTAVLCIPKIYEVSPELVVDGGLITTMQDLLQKEGNALVLANLIIALSEIQAIQKTKLIKVTPSVLQRLLGAVNECVEWGQIQIMDFLSNYIPADSKEAELIVERILPRLSHINPAVVFSSVKVCVKYLAHLDSVEIEKHLCTKLTPSLVSLLSADKQEIKFIVLKSVNHILAKQPHLLDKDIKSFYCSFTEPYYIKRQKLEILARICDKKSCENVLGELELYVTESDPQFVRMSIKAISSIAIRFSIAAEKAITILLGCIKNILEANMGGELYVQEIIITLQKIYRKYPGKINYEKGLEKTVEILEFASEEDAKSSAIWILGEFAEKIPTSIELITARINDFQHEERGVQLEILTAAIKVFVMYPDDGKNFIQDLLETASYKTLNPDVRDRAFIYWRMLSSDPETTKATVLCEKPDIQEEGLKYEVDFLQIMLDTLGQVSSVFQIYPHKLFRGRGRPQGQGSSTVASKPLETSPSKKQERDKEREKEKEKKEQLKKSAEKKAEKKEEKEPTILKAPEPEVDLLDLMDDAPVASNNSIPNNDNNNNNNNNQQQQDGGVDDLLDMMGGGAPQQQNNNNNNNNNNNQQNNNNDFDMFDNSSSNNKNQNSNLQLPLDNVMNAQQAGKQGTTGLSVDAAFNRVNGRTVFDIKFTNNTNQQLSQIILSFKPNFFGLKPEHNQPSISVAPNGGQQQIQVTMNVLSDSRDQNMPQMPVKLAVGVKTNFDIFYFHVPLYIYSLFTENGSLDKDGFKNIWKGVPENTEKSFEVKKLQQRFQDANNVQASLKLNNIFFVAQRQNDKGQTVGYYSSKTELGQVFTVEVAVPSLNNSSGATILCKSHDHQLSPLVLQSVNYILTH